MTRNWYKQNKMRKVARYIYSASGHVVAGILKIISDSKISSQLCV